MGDFFTGSSGTQSPWTEEDRVAARDALGKIGNLGDVGRRYGKPNDLQNSASNIYTEFNPSSFLYDQGQGDPSVQGFLGQGQGALGQALSALGSGGAGGSDQALADAISGKNLDVTGGAYAARNEGIANEVQRFLNQNLDTVSAGAQSATGGVGAGSAGVESRRRAVNQSSDQLGDILAQLSAQDLARERGLQQNAIGLGLEQPYKMANAYGNIGQGYQGLGSIFGQAGTAANQLALQQAQGMSGLGSTLANQQLAGSVLPIDYLLNYLTAARGQQSQSPGMFGQMTGGLGSLFQGLGSAAKGLGNMKSGQQSTDFGGGGYSWEDAEMGVPYEEPYGSGSTGTGYA